jgi:hypothetical protein
MLHRLLAIKTPSSGAGHELRLESASVGDERADRPCTDHVGQSRWASARVFGLFLSRGMSQSTAMWEFKTFTRRETRVFGYFGRAA